MKNNTTTLENSSVTTERPFKGYLLPQVNIVETQEGYLLEAEMPGVGKEGLEVALEGNELTIVGHKAQEQSSAELLYRESSQKDYRRTFVLDPTINTSRIQARIENGVLTLTLPKAEEVKPRRIQVTD
ncbi:MAG: Hsp20/alpha crystallin family protein [Verrucomicrobiota bacterium]|nr:Hsp20/alpha crystallin family protein [Verrucomicrobiota bacterium]